MLSEIDKYYAAMAAELVDVELRWRLERLPAPYQYSALDKAIIAEAEQRGLFRSDGVGQAELR